LKLNVEREELHVSTRSTTPTASHDSIKFRSSATRLSLPRPHLVRIEFATVAPVLRDVAETMRDTVQKELKLPPVTIVWYHQRLDPIENLIGRSFSAWQGPFAPGSTYHGRTLPFAYPDTIFIAAAVMAPPHLDELRDVTPYQVGTSVVHEMRHLWQAAKGWKMEDTRTIERDAGAFEKKWREKVKGAVVAVTNIG
jgi:hypothetical protein